MPLTVNIVGGALAIGALATIVFFGAGAACSVSTPVPPAVPVKPLAPHVSAGKKHHHELRHCTVEHPCHTVVPTDKPGVYRKVLKGGRLDGKVDCSQVPAVAREFSPDQVIAAAKQYGLSPAQLSALRVCLN